MRVVKLLSGNPDLLRTHACSQSLATELKTSVEQRKKNGKTTDKKRENQKQNGKTRNKNGKTRNEKCEMRV